MRLKPTIPFCAYLSAATAGCQAGPPAALSPVLLGSSRRRLRILAWWFGPVPIDRMVAIIRYLVRHPEERPRIGTVDPDVWDVFPSRV